MVPIDCVGGGTAADRATTVYIVGFGVDVIGYAFSTRRQ